MSVQKHNGNLDKNNDSLMEILRKRKLISKWHTKYMRLKALKLKFDLISILKLEKKNK